LRNLHLRAKTCQAPAFSQTDNDVYGWLQDAANRFKNVSAVDMNDTVCPEGQCKAERQGMVVFRDAQHLTATFARSLGTALGKNLQLDGKKH
jgi:hypothetical protein